MRVVLILLFFVVLGCSQQANHPLGSAINYYPQEVANGHGAVWKYYIHLKSKEGQRKTNIKYRKVAFENDKLVFTDHSADYLESYKEIITIDNNAWNIDSTITYDYRSGTDKLRIPLIYDVTSENIMLNWDNQEAKLLRSIRGEEWSNDLKEFQEEINDTIIDGLKVRVFSGKLFSNYQYKNDTTATTFNWKREFTEGRGMTAQYVESERLSYEWELDEIISIDEFNKRANHGTNRVAYIDPDEAIDDQKDFSPCFHLSKINDYYNDDRAQHPGGKGSLWEMLGKNLDETLLKGQEGYLTYRFVVNCEGEAGRFVTEEADLEYNKIEFSEGLRTHLLQLLLDVPKWKNLTINGEPRDAYVYVTFKIKNDEIIEILP